MYNNWWGVKISSTLYHCINFSFLDPDDDDNVYEYLGLMDQLIRYLVPSDVHELFQRKVRDRALMRDPNFRWCTQVCFYPIISDLIYLFECQFFDVVQVFEWLRSTLYSHLFIVLFGFYRTKPSGKDSYVSRL